jgi:diketogulonate reductase-like aldo/keto reductase
MTMTKTFASRAVLNNSVEMPYLGLGTYGIDRGEKVQHAVRFALECGYRLIDTAASYRNEREVGLAIAESAVPRSEIFVTTKVWNDDQGYEATNQACHKSLAELGLGYIDLYLIHWPVEKRLTLETWKAMIRLRDEGKCRAIGVANFTIRHLEYLLAETSVTPSVNQVEFHPFCFPKKLRDFCQDRAIQLEAYSPLANGKRLRSETIASIAAHYDKSPAQIMLRWALQHGVVVVPKSFQEHRIWENAAVFDFDLSPEDMGVLDSLNEDRRVSWYPDNWPAW